MLIQMCIKSRRGQNSEAVKFGLALENGERMRQQPDLTHFDFFALFFARIFHAMQLGALVFTGTLGHW